MANKDIFAPPTDDELNMFAPPTQEELNNTSPEQREVPEISQLGALGYGAEQGVTAGLSDELRGALQAPIGAGKSLINLLGGDLQGEDVEAYKEARDIAREKIKAAEEQHPGTFIAGNIVASFVPGAGLAKLVGPAVKGLSLVKGLEGPLNQASFFQKLTNAAKIGALSGAATAPGLSEAEKLPELAGDVAGGYLSGGVLGGGIQGGVSAGGKVLQGIKGVGSGLGKTQTVQNFLKSLGYGTEGIDLVTQEGLESAGEAVKSGAMELGLSARQVNKQAGAELGIAKKALQESGKTFDVTDDIGLITNAIDELKQSDNPLAQKDVDFLQKYLDNLLLGKETTAEFTPVATKVIETTPSLNFDEMAINKVKGSFENSPEGKQKAQTLLDKLIGKAKIEGEANKSYQLIDDAEHGFYRIVETTPKQIESIIPGEKVSKIVQAGPIQSIPTRAGSSDLQNARFNKVEDIIGTLNDFTGVSGGTQKLETTTAMNAVKRAAGSMKDKVKELPELSNINRKTAASFQALDTLGLSPDDFVKDAQTGKLRLEDSAYRKLTNLIRQSETNTSSGITSKERIREALRLLGEADQETAKKLGPKLTKSAEVLDLAQKARDIKFYRSSFIEKGPIHAGNRIGIGIKKLKDSTPEDIKRISGAMINTGQTAASRFGKSLDEIANKDATARNAMMFSLMQQPWAREVVDEWFGSKKEEK